MVPIKFRERYLELKQAHKYFEAMSYVVPISIRQYYRLLNEGRVSRNGFDFFVDARYDSEMGLLLDENEVDIPSTII